MSKKLTRSVHVQDPETGQAAWFQPGDTLPAWATKLVTNPRAFEQGDEEPSLENNVETLSKAESYESLNKSELEELCEERGLAISGTKPELVERLKASDGATG